jgi:two-component system, chemotaxis family, protein-glutamate methylesterase/glutaminase
LSRPEEPGRIHAVVVGASAGGVEALKALVGALPADFPAVVLVVLHLAPTATSLLPQILGRAGSLPASHAEDSVPMEGGHVYVAPPNQHLLVDDGHLRLDRGPRVNGHRPAVDALFRSAAASFGSGTAGVVLSGVLDDGTAGLLAIKRVGGLTFVQDPEEALYDGMPRSAIELARPDHVARAFELGEILRQVAATPPPDPPLEEGAMREEHAKEVDRGSTDRPQPGESIGLTCPECQGGIWVDEEHGTLRYRCRVGHEFSEETFVAEQGNRVETALWTALRALEERAALHRRMAARAADRGQGHRADRYEHGAADAMEQAVVLRELLSTFVRGAEEEVA